MKRTFNYTGRRKIALEEVHVRLGESEEFYASVDLDATRFPADAMVVVEAYERTAYQRFELGPVEGPRVEGPFLLERVQPETAQFRVKVVSADDKGVGRLLGVADRVRPSSGDGTEPGTGYQKEPLLHAESADLGGPVWRLDLSGTWPTIQWERDLQSDFMGKYVGTSPVFRALVYPEVVRQILTYILVLEGDGAYDDDPTGWRYGWLEFASTLLPEDPPPINDEDAAPAWIDIAVQAFAMQFEVVDQIQKFLPGADND
jgi:hypothetical protein